MEIALPSMQDVDLSSFRCRVQTFKLFPLRDEEVETDFVQGNQNSPLVDSKFRR